MKGIIIVNAYSKLSHSLNQSERLKGELSLLGVESDIVPNNRFFAYIEKGRVVCDTEDYDFCVYLDKDKYVSKLLEKNGMKLFNSHEAIRICDDKFETFIRLSDNGIDMPLTLPGLLCYDSNEDIRTADVEKIEKKLSYPIVVKNCYGSLGEGVFLANNRDELVSIMKSVKMQPHLFQRYISSSKGRDVRVIVIGNKVVASMIRQSDGDFRSNLELGGHGSSFILPESFKVISEKVSQVIGLDYCGVDLLFGEDGKPILCEVNSNAFFGGIEKVTGVNVAALYAEHIIKVMQDCCTRR